MRESVRWNFLCKGDCQGFHLFSLEMEGIKGVRTNVAEHDWVCPKEFLVEGWAWEWQGHLFVS